MADVEIRRFGAGDEAAWRDLWAGYLAFYRASVGEEVTAGLWRKLTAGDAEVFGFAAVVDGKVVGFVHHVLHATTWSTDRTCYLHDLYVGKGQRGGGVARKLMDAVFADAAEKGASRCYWHTQEFNAAARSLYDTIVPRSSFIVYRRPLP